MVVSTSTSTCTSTGTSSRGSNSSSNNKDAAHESLRAPSNRKRDGSSNGKNCNNGHNTSTTNHICIYINIHGSDNNYNAYNKLAKYDEYKLGAHRSQIMKAFKHKAIESAMRQRSDWVSKKR